MDAVITYVNGLDPLWRKDYAQSIGKMPLTKHYRDWGTLKYLLRGIDKHIPDIKNVFLVVSSESQIPDFINTGNVHIVLHRDIIPVEFLPTFNSTTIEMFIHRIPGLDEHFLYFNDDTFPVSNMSETDFFENGKIVFGFSKHLIANSIFKYTVKNSDRLARKATGKKSGLMFIRPQHSCAPMIKSECEKLFKDFREEIYVSLSRVRCEKNLSQYLFTDFLYYQNMAVNRRQSNKHLSPSVHSLEKIVSYIAAPRTKMININDTQIDSSKFEAYRNAVDNAFKAHFPKRSRFENQ